MSNEIINKDHEDLTLVIEELYHIEMYLIKKDPGILSVLPHQSKEIYQQLLQENADVIQYVPEQTEDLCMIAVTTDPTSLSLILPNKQTDKVIRKAISSGADVFQYIAKQNISESIILASLKYKDNISNMIDYIPKELYTPIVLTTIAMVDPMTLIQVERQGYAHIPDDVFKIMFCNRQSTTIIEMLVCGVLWFNSLSIERFKILADSIHTHTPHMFINCKENIDQLISKWAYDKDSMIKYLEPLVKAIPDPTVLRLYYDTYKGFGRDIRRLFRDRRKEFRYSKK